MARVSAHRQQRATVELVGTLVLQSAARGFVARKGTGAAAVRAHDRHVRQTLTCAPPATSKLISFKINS